MSVRAYVFSGGGSGACFKVSAQCSALCLYSSLNLSHSVTFFVTSQTLYNKIKIFSASADATLRFDVVKSTYARPNPRAMLTRTDLSTFIIRSTVVHSRMKFVILVIDGAAATGTMLASR